MQAYAKSAIKIAIGLLCGSLFNEKQGAVFTEALLINLTAWLSDTWFDLDSVGSAFKAVADMLLFLHADKAGRIALSDNYSSIFQDLWWVIGYTVVMMALAILIFTGMLNSDNTLSKYFMK